MLPGINYPKKLINAGCDFIDKAGLEVRQKVSESDVTLFEPHLRYLSCKGFTPLCLTWAGLISDGLVMTSLRIPPEV